MKYLDNYISEKLKVNSKSNINSDKTIIYNEFAKVLKECIFDNIDHENISEENFNHQSDYSAFLDLKNVYDNTINFLNISYIQNIEKYNYGFKIKKIENLHGHYTRIQSNEYPEIFIQVIYFMNEITAIRMNKEIKEELLKIINK